MAFVTGTATSASDLLVAVRAACTANGWTLTGNVLSKGTCFVELTVVGAQLTVQGGTGQTSGVLAGRATSTTGALGQPVILTGTPNVTYSVNWPVSYFIHIGDTPDEVYLFINYQTNCYQWLAFGQSDMPGLPGTGNWYYGVHQLNFNGNGFYLGNTGDGAGAAGYRPAIFNDSGDNRYLANVYGGVHHGFTDAPTNPGAWQYVMSYFDAALMRTNSPSQWNGESVLIPIQVYTARASAFFSMIAQLKHMRWVMIDNLNDQQIITLGSERWKVYPMWRRSPRNMAPTGTVAVGGTGTFGYAVRYDGP